MGKKLVVFILAALMVVSVLTGCAQTTNTPVPAQEAAAAPAQESAPETAQAAPESDGASEAMKMVMITDTGGLGDGGFNDMAWNGLEMAKEQLGFEIAVIESTEASQYASNMSAAAQQGYDIIVCVGFLLEDALKEVAPQYPDTKFVMIDGSVDGPNIYSYKYKLNEGGFLAGALAAYVTKADNFGTVGGMEIPDVVAWESGFVAGVKTINPNAEVKTTYVGTFADPGKAKELALAQFNAGAAAIMEISSGGAIGVIEAARDAGKLFVATDKSKDSFAPGFELTAALAARDVALFEAAKQIHDGTAVAGTTLLSMKDGVFGLPDNTEERYGKDAVDLIAKLKEMIISGQIVVPATKDEVAAYQAPDLGLK